MRVVAMVVIALALSSARAHANVLVNGDFETGTFAGWTPFATSANGSIGTTVGGRAIVPFDVTGSGATDAARFQVGQISFTPGILEGGGIRQTITTGAGMAVFHADIAAQETHGTGNAAGGLFVVLLDGVALASFDFGFIAALDTERSSLDFTAPVTTGAHVLSLQMTRPFVSGALGISPFQYFDNVSLNVSSVDEPATLLLVGLGLAGIGVSRRKAH
jgi:PEP-CTERM motif